MRRLDRKREYSVHSVRAPFGYVRLTLNVRKDAQWKLKLVAAVRGTTMSALLESFIDALPFDQDEGFYWELPLNQSRRRPEAKRPPMKRIGVGHKASD